MGLFSFLHKSPKQQHDDFFGLITFRPYKHADEDYFVGCKYFTPIDSDVDFLLYASYKGPAQTEIDFFKKIENEYNTYLKKSMPMLLLILKEKLLKGQFKLIETDDFDSEFKLARIVFPKPNSQEWQLDFSTVHDVQHEYSVHFTEENPIRVSVNSVEN